MRACGPFHRLFFCLEITTGSQEKVITEEMGDGLGVGL
jgi:hypothetical protein